MSFTKTTSLALSMVFLVGAIVLGATVFQPTAHAVEYQKHLLVLQSYKPGYKWTDDITVGITAAMTKGGGGIRIDQEYMDAKRVSDARYLALLYQTYRYKFRNSRFDAVLAVDDDAFNMMLKYRDLLFPGTPVIFCGVNDLDPSRLHGIKGFTGVNEAADIRSTLDLVLKLHPRTRRIVVINDTTTTGRKVHDQIMRLLPLYRGKVDFRFLEDVEMPEILSVVQGLEPGTVVFYTFFFRDKAGRLFDFNQSISMIAARCPVPIYGAWDFNLGFGIVGGMLTSGYNQGKTAGEMALRVLRGEKADDLPVVMKSPNRYLFDYRQLRRFKIDEKDLPPGSVVINRQLDTYKIHRSVIWATVSALGGLVLIILLLLRSMRIRRRAEAALARSELELRKLTEELEERVRERTRELEQSRHSLEKQHEVLQQTYRELQVEAEARFKMMEELRLREQLLIHQSRMAAMGEMLGNIAHQWRQPLNVLGLKIQEIGMCSRFGKLDKELVDTNVTNAMELVYHLSRTIDDFRTFSTPGKEKVTFSVNEIVAKTLSLIGEGLRSHGIKVETETEGELEIEGYPNEYAQVLLNILMNSKDAFIERQISDPRILVRAWSEDGRTNVVISDNAGGIDETIIERIFDPYFTTKEQGKGTGVGLFMSKKIVEEHMGGRLVARNVDGGVEMTITV